MLYFRGSLKEALAVQIIEIFYRPVYLQFLLLV